MKGSFTEWKITLDTFTMSVCVFQSNIRASEILFSEINNSKMYFQIDLNYVKVMISMEERVEESSVLSFSKLQRKQISYSNQTKEWIK